MIIEENINKRCEDGTEHHELSELLMLNMRYYSERNGDLVDLKIGGDGDSGEALMYLMDIVFDRLTLMEHLRFVQAIGPDRSSWGS